MSKHLLSWDLSSLHRWFYYFLSHFSSIGVCSDYTSSFFLRHHFKSKKPPMETTIWKQWRLEYQTRSDLEWSKVFCCDKHKEAVIMNLEIH